MSGVFLHYNLGVLSREFEKPTVSFSMEEDLSQIEVKVV